MIDVITFSVSGTCRILRRINTAKFETWSLEFCMRFESRSLRGFEGKGAEEADLGEWDSGKTIPSQ